MKRLPMDTVERLSKLKKLKIERHDGPLFKSPNDCMEWIDKVLPLLKYDQQYYTTQIFIIILNMSASLHCQQTH